MGAWKDLDRIKATIGNHVRTCPHCFLALASKNAEYSCEVGKGLVRYYEKAIGLHEPEPTAEEWFLQSFGFVPSKN